MEITTDGFSDSSGLNVELFNPQGKPMEFSIEGYDQEQCIRIVDVVKAFGGKLSNSYAPRTIIFSDPNYVSELSFNRFNIKFLEDSIRAQKLQQLEKYRITSSVNGKSNHCTCLSMHDLEREPKVSLTKMQTNRIGNQKHENGSSQNNSLNCESITEKYGKILRSCSIPLVRIRHKSQSAPVKEKRNTKSNIHSIKKIQCHHIVKVTPNVIKVPTMRNDRAKVFPFLQSLTDSENKSPINEKSYQGVITNIALSSSIDMLKSPPSTVKVQRMGNGNTEEPLLNSDSMNEHQKTQHCGPSVYKHEQNMNKSYSRTSNDKTSSEDHMFTECFTTRQFKPSRTCNVVASWSNLTAATSANSTDKFRHTIDQDECDEKNESVHTYPFHRSQKLIFLEAPVIVHCDDDSSTNGKEHVFFNSVKVKILTSDLESTKSTTESPISACWSPSALSKREQQVQKIRKKCHYYSYEENRRIVQYIIDKNAIHQVQSMKLWKSFLADEVLDQPRPSPGALRDHWNRTLQENYKEYIDDPAAIRECEKRNSSNSYYQNKKSSKEKLTTRISPPPFDIRKSSRLNSLRMSLLKNQHGKESILINDIADEQKTTESRNASIDLKEFNKSYEKEMLESRNQEAYSNSGEENIFSECNRRSLFSRATRVNTTNDNLPHEYGKKSSQNHNNENGNTINVWKPHEFHSTKNTDDYSKTNQKRAGSSDSAEGKASTTYTESVKFTTEESCSLYSPSDNEFDRDSNAKKLTQTSANAEEKSIVKKHRYTEEENRRLIQYLIDNNKISLARSENTWKEFLANEVLKDPQPTAGNLLGHVRSILKNYKKYTNDPIASAEFKERLASKQWLLRYFTEEEDRCIINYLIDNNAICRALSKTIWKGCLEASPILQASGRTVKKLQARFYYHLRYSYAKYTDDPEALRLFKEMEVKRPHHGHFKKAIHDDFFDCDE